MRLHGLLPIPLALITALAAAAPAMAPERTVDVTQDFAFAPKQQKINPGDTVVWSFSGSGHTTTSARGQAESWNSEIREPGQRFEHTFDTPGRYQYVCKPHKRFMKGVITVGEDAVGDTFDAFKTKRGAAGVTVSVKLNEPAKVTYTLSGESSRKVSRGRLKAGRHSFKVKGLPAGSYRGNLTTEDDFDKKSTASQGFAIG
jgi:plastocyanin